MNARIKKLRKELNLTQQRFADCIGTTANVLTNYETGRRNPSSSVINNICKTFNVNEEWLRTGEGEMFAQTSDNLLDILAEKYGLSRSARILVEEFVNLKPDIQQAFVDYALKVAASLAHETAPLPAPSEEPHSMTVAEAEAEYIKAMSERAQQQERTASNTTAAEKIG